MNKHKLNFNHYAPRNSRLTYAKGSRITINSDKTDKHYIYMYGVNKWVIEGSPEHEEAKKHKSIAQWPLVSSTHEDCNSFRKFKRRLRKQPELIGITIFVNRYVLENGTSLNIESVE